MNRNKDISSLPLDLRTLVPGQILRLSPRDEKICHSLLRGDFSGNLIARTVPQMKIEAGLRQSYVFEILPDPQHPWLRKFFIALTTLKRQDIILLFFPLLLVLIQNLKMGLLPRPLDLWLCFVGLISLVISLRFRNEYVDHMQGLDRWNPQFAKSPLFRGQLRAFEVNQFAFVFLGLALGSLAGLLIRHPSIALIAVPAGILALSTQYFHLSAFKEKPYGEVLVFILFGPLFVSGLELSLFKRIQFWNFIDGFIVGLASMFLLNLKVFSNFLYLAQMDSKNSLIRFGFDRAKEYLLISLFLILLLFCAYQFYVLHSEPWGYLVWIGLILSLIFLSVRFLLAYRSCQSSAGSALKLVHARGTEAIYSVYLLWLSLQLWLMFAPGH